MKQEIRKWLKLFMTNLLHRVGVIKIVEDARKVCTTWGNISKGPAMWKWLKLSMTNILHKVGVIKILEDARKVWRNICKGPAMWKVMLMNNFRDLFAWPWSISDPFSLPTPLKISKQIVDRSQGQLVDVTIELSDDELLHYVADRSSQLRRLQIVSCDRCIPRNLYKALEKFPLLEELNLYKMEITEDDIETAGRCCPMLRKLKVNKEEDRVWYPDTDNIAIAIGRYLPELRHLELIGNTMTDFGLQMILDGCHHLESLDLRKCLNIDLKGDVVKKFLKTFKCLKLPNDSVKGCPFLFEDDYDEDYDYDYDYDDNYWTV